jgi:hypothetical protein
MNNYLFNGLNKKLGFTKYFLFTLFSFTIEHIIYKISTNNAIKNILRTIFVLFEFSVLSIYFSIFFCVVISSVDDTEFLLVVCVRSTTKVGCSDDCISEKIHGFDKSVDLFLSELDDDIIYIIIYKIIFCQILYYMSKKSKTIYCGVDKLKSNQRLGTAKECAELKQVRYYGLKKISKKVVEETKGMPVQSEARLLKLSKKRGGLRGKIMKIKDEIEDYKNEEDYIKNKTFQKAVAKLQTEMKELKEELSKVNIKIKELSK